MGVDLELELDGLNDLELDELAGRIARRRRRRLLPGRDRVIAAGAFDVPAAAPIPWHHPELLGILPAGWGPADLEAALRNAISSPMYRMTARASFGGLTANEAATAELTAQNRNFVGWRLFYSKSNPDLSITAQIRQAERFPLSGETKVRLEALFGSDHAAAGSAEGASIITLLVPRQPLKIELVAEGAAPGAAHNVDFTLLGWLLPGQVAGGEASG